MRNIFDQYHLPENRLTHALYCTLAQEHRLLRPFLSWLGINHVPPRKDLKIVEQQIPGAPICDDDGEGSGLPDLCVFTEEGWAVFLEMKVQSHISAKQLRLHRKAASRYGFHAPHLVTVTVDVPKATMPPDTVSKQWRELYAWFDRERSKSFWARTLVDYMEVFESKAIASEYGVRGTITMFNGLRFDADNPYNYREGKRLIRLLGDELQATKDLQDGLGVDSDAPRRPAITRGRGVWDFLPMRFARGKGFIRFPHLTMVIREDCAIAATTVPNSVSGGFRTKLKQMKFDGFLALLRDIERRLRPVIIRAEKSKPNVYAVQRHYRTQSSLPVLDARLDADLRTCQSESNSSPVKYQIEWAEAIYRLLLKKRSNIQFGIEMQFDYSSPVVRSSAAVDLFVGSWIAMRPLLDFVRPAE